MQHVWINHDTDLLDVTLRDDVKSAAAPTQTKQRQAAVAAHGAQAPPSAARQTSDETIQTTEKHPWLTVDKGWLKAGQLRVGEQVVRLDGSTATLVGLHQRTGEQADYYNLTVSDLHTYAVGAGQFVVHNCGKPVRYGSNDLSKVVQWMRTGLRERGGNFAAATLDDGSTIGAKSSGAVHAEEDLLAQATGRGRQIVSLYSEREPCVDCESLLLGDNPNMDITYTWKHRFPGLKNPKLGRYTNAINKAIRRATMDLF